MLRRLALQIFGAALDAAEAGAAVRKYFSVEGDLLRIAQHTVRLSDFKRVFLVSAGKAAPAMAEPIIGRLGSSLAGGIAVTKHGHLDRPLTGVQVYESAHPVPDEAGVYAARETLKLLQQLGAQDLLIVAISGGASALLPAPLEPITLEDKQGTTDRLLRAGATIQQLNAVRKHLSRLKGGRMAAAAYPATVFTLLLSDVMGDQLDVIGSGPCVPDSSTFLDALEVLRKFDLVGEVPRAVRNVLLAGAAGKIPETPKRGDPIFENVHNVIVGSNRGALYAARRRAMELGYRTLILSSSMGGDTTELAHAHAAILREIRQSGNPVQAPACILSGGETTVHVKGTGKGGRNQEFALAAAIEIEGLNDVLVLSAGTDGTDGPTDAAGAVAAGDTVERAKACGLNARTHLADNNSYPFFVALDDVVMSGPTGTNVMDVRMLLAGSPDAQGS